MRLTFYQPRRMPHNRNECMPVDHADLNE